MLLSNVVIKHIKLGRACTITTFVDRVVEYMFGMCMEYFILFVLQSMQKGEIDELQLI